eukprot:365624-Chlamydomonas_euryale.AAC.2
MTRYCLGHRRHHHPAGCRRRRRAPQRCPSAASVEPRRSRRRGRSRAERLGCVGTGAGVSERLMRRMPLKTDRALAESHKPYPCSVSFKP